MPNLIIVRGLPGSGKTTLAKTIDGVLVEADQYHTAPDGTYRYDGSKSGKAHKWCLEETERLLRDGQDVVVANVFEQRWQIRPYYELAEKLGIQVATVNATGKYHNSHNVPIPIIEKMAKRWELGYGENVTIEGVVVSVPKISNKEVVFRLEVNSEQTFSDCSRIYIRTPLSKMPTDPVRGEVWRVNGSLQVDYFFSESICPDKCERVKPSGKNLLGFLVNHNSLYRLREKTANRLFSRIENLEAVLDGGEIEPLIAKDKGKLTYFQAEQLLGLWKAYLAELGISRWLSDLNLPASLLSEVLHFWSDKAIIKIEENPFRLLAFCPWPVVDKIAMAKFSIKNNDPRRQVAAMEQTCYSHYDKGNTVVPYNSMCNDVQELLEYCINIEDIPYAYWNDSICQFTGDGSFQLAGAFTLERFVENELLQRNIQPKFNSVQFDSCRLNEFEIRKTNKLREQGKIHELEVFKLNTEQRVSVRMTLDNPVSVILGGAGVGKTTVLEAIYDQIDDKSKIFPMAFTGLATKVLKENGAENPQTIARFLKSASLTPIPDDSYIFIDEASMLDLPTMYGLLSVLPVRVHICFIGDYCQLPPICPGLILLPIFESKTIPQTELSEVHRQAAITGIPTFAGLIRNCINLEKSTFDGVFDYFSGLNNKDYGVSFIENRNDVDMFSKILEIYNELSSFGGVKIIAPTNRTCMCLNEIISDDHLLTRKYQKLPCYLIGLSIIGEDQRKQHATVGDQIIWHGINDYKRELFNGMIGVLSNVLPTPIMKIGNNGQILKIIAEAIFDGNIFELSIADLVHVSLGYAVTCHKAQGSQFERVIVVVEPTGLSDIIDSTWLYTAVTRAKRQVVMFGDKSLFTSKVVQRSKASQRTVGIKL